MADITFEDVLELAEQLTPEEQTKLIERLTAKPMPTKRPPLNFPVDDLVPLRDSFSLHRKDWYGDEER